MGDKTTNESAPAFEEMPLWTKLAGFLCFQIIKLLLIVVVLAMLIGCILYPRTVGLYLVIPYYTCTLIFRRDELNDGNHWHRFSKDFPLFSPMRRFLGLEIATPPSELAEAEKRPNAQFLFAVFPHGTQADFRILMDGMLLDVFPNVSEKCRVLAATVLFRIPIVREVALWTGCVDARRSVAESLLDHGRSVIVLPGGMAEQIRTTRGKEIVYLQNRKGFLKLSMRKGVPVVPVYVFGASDHYHTSHALFVPRLWLMKNLGACITLDTGYMCSLTCPFPIKTTIVFGQPLSFDMKEKGSPTSQELDAAHTKFIMALTRLFDEHKIRLGCGDRKLEII
jgi:2-acylglycerol O-acyltransferase 2